MHDQRWKGHMETVVVLLAMMMTAGLSHGEPLPCDARQNGTQCFAASGGTVEIRLVERIETGREYKLYKGAIKDPKEVLVFNFKQRNFYPKQTYINRSNLIDSNGTFRMHDVTKSDEGHYHLDIFNKEAGSSLGNRTLHLSVQAPVTSPTLSSECLSHEGRMSLSCSCEGDRVQYNWTLDGEPLTTNQLFSGGRQDAQNITLTEDLSGLLMCVVSNSVSRAAATKNITACPGFKYIDCSVCNCLDSNGTREWVNDTTSCPPLTTTAPPTTTTPTTTPSPSIAPVFDFLPYIVGSLAALLLLLVVGVGIYCSQKKKKKSTVVTKPDAACQDVTYADVTFIRKPNTAAAAGAGSAGSAAGSAGAADDDVTYADVRAFQRKSKKWSAEKEVQYGQLMKVVKTTTADSVEYGEVKVSPGAAGPSQDSADRRPTEDESCVYSKVKVSGADDCVYSKVKVSPGADDCVYSKVKVSPGADDCVYSKVKVSPGADDCV